MAEPQTVIEGARTIARQPIAPPEERWAGSIDNEDFAEETWLGGTVEQVIDVMQDYLGHVPEDQFVVQE